MRRFIIVELVCDRMDKSKIWNQYKKRTFRKISTFYGKIEKPVSVTIIRLVLCLIYFVIIFCKYFFVLIVFPIHIDTIRVEPSIIQCIQDLFHVYLNKFENAVTHLFLVIFGNN